MVCHNFYQKCMSHTNCISPLETTEATHFREFVNYCHDGSAADVLLKVGYKVHMDMLLGFIQYWQRLVQPSRPASICFDGLASRTLVTIVLNYLYRFIPPKLSDTHHQSRGLTKLSSQIMHLFQHFWYQDGRNDNLLVKQ